jgi:DNA-binding IclR family transcriptional regulator
MTAPIYNRSMCTVLSLFEESTKDLHYLGGLLTETTLSKPTVSKVLNRLCEAGYLRKQPENLPFQRDRAPRINYELTSYGLHALRLMSPST